MTPHPVRDVDMERKEELILAKQLRAARVTILSRVGSRSDQSELYLYFSLGSRQTYSMSNLSGKRKKLLLRLRPRSRMLGPLPELRTPWLCATGISAAVRHSNQSSTFPSPRNLSSLQVRRTNTFPGLYLTAQSQNPQ